MFEVILNKNHETIFLKKLLQEYSFATILRRLLIMDSLGNNYRIINYYTNEQEFYFALINLKYKTISDLSEHFSTLQSYIADLIENNYKVYFETT